MISSWDHFIKTYASTWDSIQNTEKWPPDLTRTWVDALISGHEIDINSLRAISWGSTQSDLGFLPLYQERFHRFGIPFNKIGPLFNTFCIRHALPSTHPLDLSITAILDEVSKLRSWDIFVIDKLLQSSQEADAWIREMQSQKLSYDIKLSERSPYLKIDCGWDEFLSKKSNNFRYNLRRKNKKLASEHQIKILEYTDSSDIPAVMQAIARIEQGSWKKQSGTAIISRPWEQKFYEQLLTGLAITGQVLCTILQLDNKPAAYDISLLSHGIGYCLKTSFHSDYASLSPGLVLRTHLMKRVFDLGLKEYDFLGEAERYKLEWSTTVRQYGSITLYNDNMQGRLLAALNKISKYRSK